MKRLIIGPETLLVGDGVAEAVVGYAVLLARLNTSDAVTLNALSEDGDDTTATVVLSQGVSVIAASTHSSLPDPDATELLAHIQAETERLRTVAAELSRQQGHG